MSESNGTSRILSLDDTSRNAKDSGGRTLRHNATILDAHHIAVEEAKQVHEWYLRQLPPFVGALIVDCLVAHGVIKAPEPVTPAPTADDKASP